jgi:hypothetical protein
VRKYLAIVLSVIFILSFAVTAFAIHETGEPAISKGAQIILGGKILVRGWYFDNVSSNLPVSTQSQALYSTNANIMIDANVSDNVRGFMELETSSGGNGNANSGLFYWGAIDTKPAADLFFRQLWIQYTGSGIGAPAGIKAGHMPITLGEKQFLCNERFGDDAILLWVDPTKEVHLVLGTTKLAEGTTALGSIAHSDDLDGYMLIATFMVNKDNTIGLNYTLVHSDGLGSPPTTDKLNFNNLGLHANGKVSGLTYAAEVDFQFGKLDGLGGAADTKFGGYGIFAKLGYMVDPVGLRASFAMGSGDSTADNKNKEFQTLQGPDAIGATARLVHYTQIYERTIRTAANAQTLTSAVRNNGIANTTYYNLGMDVNPTKEINLSLDGFIIRATKAWQADQSKSVGSEVDFKGTYKLAKNLSYFVEAGVFTPGKFYTTGTGVGTPVNGGLDKKTVTQAVHGLLLTF